MALAEGAAALTSISNDAGPGTGAFAPGTGVRDVDLVRGQFAPGASLTVHADVSALVYATTGQVTAEDVTIAAGSTSIRDGDVTLVNDADEPATVVVAAIGQTVDLSGSAVEPSATPAPAPAPAPAPTTASPTAMRCFQAATRSTPPTSPDGPELGVVVP